jgi:hypothetical protein
MKKEGEWKATQSKGPRKISTTTPYSKNARKQYITSN